MASQGVNHSALSDAPLGTCFEHAIDLSSERSQPGDLAVDRDKIGFGYRIDGRAGLFRLGGQMEQAADVVDLESQVAGMSDEEQAA
jgi:hypothetical protein